MPSHGGRRHRLRTAGDAGTALRATRARGGTPMQVAVPAASARGEIRTHAPDRPHPSALA